MESVTSPIAASTNSDYYPTNFERGMYNEILNSTAIQNAAKNLFAKLGKAIQKRLFKDFQINTTGKEVVEFLDSSFGRHLGGQLELQRCRTETEVVMSLESKMQYVRKAWGDFQKSKKQTARWNSGEE